MRARSFFIALLLLATAACGSGGGDTPFSTPRIVNSLADLASPPAGEVTLRSALAAAESGDVIRFHPDLDGQTIALGLVGEAHSILKGEVMGIREEESGPVSYLVGYFERDYGASALYARKNVTIDASSLPNGIEVVWANRTTDARVLAVYGTLVLRNVTIRGGRSVAVALDAPNPEDQPWTLARGGGVAVWGTARLSDCVLHDNRCEGDFDSSRDRGAFGGGIYADVLHLEDCLVAGNTVVGGGAAGGGVYTVGGADSIATRSTLVRTAVCGNAIHGLFTYGAGVYSDGGGIGNRKRLELENVTIARNLVTPAPGLPPFLLGMGYWRGGGVYMSNGYLEMRGCTVVQNEVHGHPRTDELGKANLAGGIAATIGNAHAVEEMIVGQSIVCGNTVSELAPDGTITKTYDHDVFTGTLLYFRSRGYNCFGTLDFSQILVPVPLENWWSLSRRHFPKEGDGWEMEVSDVLDLDGGVSLAPGVLSTGVMPGTPVPVAFVPRGPAVDRVPAGVWPIHEVLAECRVDRADPSEILPVVLGRLEDHYGLPGFANDFTAAFESFLQSVDTDPETPGLQPYLDPEGDPILLLSDVRFFGPAATWPKVVANWPYIEFWHRLDDAVAAAVPTLGPEGLGDDAWASLFSSGVVPEAPRLTMAMTNDVEAVPGALAGDQGGTARPVGGAGDIGAVEGP